MRPKPSAADILETARKALRGDLLGVLPESRRYQALMVANALAIAARVLARGEAPEREELASLARLMGDSGDTNIADPVTARERLGVLYNRLCDELRSGKIVSGTERHRAVFDHLWRTTLERVRESNPKALPGG